MPAYVNHNVPKLKYNNAEILSELWKLHRRMLTFLMVYTIFIAKFLFYKLKFPKILILTKRIAQMTVVCKTVVSYNVIAQ